MVVKMLGSKHYLFRVVVRSLVFSRLVCEITSGNNVYQICFIKLVLAIIPVRVFNPFCFTLSSV